MEEKLLLEKLTGVHSSKKSYYVELKNQISETKKRNTQLEILFKLANSMNVDAEISETMDKLAEDLVKVLSFDLMKLVTWMRNPARLSEEKLEWTHEGGGLGGNDEDFEQVIDLPLKAKDRVIGYLTLGNKIKKHYSDSELFFMEQLATQLSVCLENQRLYEEALRRKVEWEETFRAVKDPIFIIDLDFNLQRVNDAVLSCYQMQENEIAGQKCYWFLHKRSEPCNPCPALEVMSRHKPSQQQVQLHDGRIFEFFYYPIFNAENNLYGIIQYARDVTRKMEMEANWRNLSKQVALGEMAARMAHELNNPLTVVLGNIQVVLMEMSEQHPDFKSLKDALNHSLRCQKIVRNLLNLTRHEKSTEVPLDLHHLIEECLESTKFQVDYGQVAVEKDFYAHLPVIQANPEQLKQVFINLITNAWDALKINGNEKILTLKTGVIDEQAYVKVEDNGSGIRPEHMWKIFDPFFTTKEQGAGLGLSISQDIAKSHGGEISVKSEPGWGTSFTLTIPLISGYREEEG